MKKPEQREKDTKIFTYVNLREWEFTNEKKFIAAKGTGQVQYNNAKEIYYSKNINFSYNIQ